MGRYYHSDYAVNKFSKGIVYRFAGRTVEVTLEDYLAENPDGTVEEFQRLKAASDAIYRRQDLDTYNQCRLNISVQDLGQSVDHTAPTFEELCWDKLDSQDILRAYQQLRDNGQLTGTQCRRFELYIFQGLSLREIAAAQGCRHLPVYRSIMRVIEKIRIVIQ